MKWSEAVRKWNESRGWVPRSKVKWVTPKKGSAEHAEVRKLMKEVMEASASTAEIVPMPMVPQPMILSGTVSSMPAMMSVTPDVVRIPMRRKKVELPAPIAPAPIAPAPVFIGVDLLRRFLHPVASPATMDKANKIMSDAEDPLQRRAIIEFMRRGELVTVSNTITDDLDTYFTEMTDKPVPARLGDEMDIEIISFVSPAVDYGIELRRADYTVNGLRRKSELVGRSQDHGYEYMELINSQLEDQEVDDDQRIQAYRDFAQALRTLVNKREKSRDDVDHLDAVVNALYIQ